MKYELFRVLSKEQKYKEIFETSTHILAIKYSKDGQSCRYLLMPQTSVVGTKCKILHRDIQDEGWPLSLLPPPHVDGKEEEEWTLVQESDFPFVFGGIPARSKKRHYL